MYKKLTYILWAFAIFASLATIKDACDFIYQNYVNTNKSMVTEFVTIDSFDNVYVYFKNKLGMDSKAYYVDSVDFELGSSMPVYTVNTEYYYTNKNELLFKEVNWEIHSFIIFLSLLLIVRSLFGIYKCWKEDKIICILKEI